MNDRQISLYGDSRAERSEAIWSQHQTLITLMHDFLLYESLGPEATAGEPLPLKWLDICSGQGQVVAHCRKSILSADLRSRIRLVAFDGKKEYLEQTRSEASLAELGDCKTIHGDISGVADLINDEKFHLVTCTNSFHEFSPWVIPQILSTMLNSLEPNGLLYVYDMASLGKNNELGAVPWTPNEMKELVNSLQLLCGGGPEAIPQSWQHKSVTGWSALIRKASFEKQIEYGAVASEMRSLVKNMIESKISLCQSVLEAFTHSGASTEEERTAATENLHLNWALTRALRSQID